MSCLKLVEPLAQHMNTAAVVGVGVVGGAMADALEAVGHVVIRHDPAKGLDAGERLGDAEVFFVCVPTPYAAPSGVELTLVRAVLQSLPAGVPIVLRSTVLPGTTEQLQQAFPDHPLLHAPEFLTEATAQHDELYPARKIVGFTPQSRAWAEAVLLMMPAAPYERVLPVRAAELIKYFANVFYATTVSFVNQTYDLCQELGIDYELVRDAAAADPMMSSSHLEVWHRGYRGYGGKCLPKDTRALVTLADRLGVDLGVAAAAQRYNDRLVGHEPEADRAGAHPECGPCASH